MSAKRAFFFFNQGCGRQHGAALMVMLVILVIGAATILVNSLNSATLQTERDKKTAEALAQAKDALIGYAVTYYDTHSTPTPQTFGFLPCPDLNGSAGNGEGSSNTCGSKNVSTIGRLPWKTLGLPVLRDGNGECLWYAVAGTYKNNPNTDIMDWDTNGLFQVSATSGVTLTGTTADSQAVAVVFSPGVPFSSQSQNRAPDGNAPICGGNYTASNYLDSDSTIGANNSTPSATANAITQFFTSGATANINDQIIYITKSDIFNAIKKRNHFDTFVATLLSAATACLSSLPNPITIDFNVANLDSTSESAGITVGNLITGRIPYSACTNSLVRQWRDNLLYAVCTSGTGSGCLTVNMINPVSSATCSGAIIFAGDRTSSQSRTTNTDKNNWSNYLEDTPSATYTAFTTGSTSIPGASAYSTTSTSTDIVACIP
jgi:type II secretory pathway pseudopilin PulG